MLANRITKSAYPGRAPGRHGRYSARIASSDSAAGRVAGNAACVLAWMGRRATVAAAFVRRLRTSEGPRATDAGGGCVASRASQALGAPAACALDVERDSRSSTGVARTTI